MNELEAGRIIYTLRKIDEDVGSLLEVETTSSTGEEVTWRKDHLFRLTKDSVKLIWTQEEKLRLISGKRKYDMTEMQGKISALQFKGDNIGSVIEYSDCSFDRNSYYKNVDGKCVKCGSTPVEMIHGDSLDELAGKEAILYFGFPGAFKYEFKMRFSGVEKQEAVFTVDKIVDRDIIVENLDQYDAVNVFSMKLDDFKQVVDDKEIFFETYLQSSSQNQVWMNEGVIYLPVIEKDAVVKFGRIVKKGEELRYKVEHRPCGVTLTKINGLTYYLGGGANVLGFDSYGVLKTDASIVYSAEQFPNGGYEKVYLFSVKEKEVKD